MADKVRDVMTTHPITLASTETLAAAAKQMRDADVGVVVVTDNGSIAGLVTDRDIVVRGIAEDLDPFTTSLASCCTSSAVVTVAPDDSIDHAVRLMREHAVRRLLVTQGGKPVAIVSIGDLAIEQDEDSALADISAAESNN
jgi:CBS domain-containing protein